MKGQSYINLDYGFKIVYHSYHHNPAVVHEMSRHASSNGSAEMSSEFKKDYRLVLFCGHFVTIVRFAPYCFCMI